MSDEPVYLPVGTEVSAKYKGAFCEAKIRKIVRVVKCKVTFKSGLGSTTLLDDQIKGTLRIGNTVEAKHHDKNQFVEGIINKIQDCSQYTVVFDDGDITTLRRSALVLKSGRHFNESETLDQLPLTHPEHFSNPVVGGRRGGVRRRAANTEDNDRDDSSEDEDIPVKKGRKKPLKEADMGKVVCVDSTDKKKLKDNWFPALVVSPSAQETVKIRTKDEYLVRSFRDGRYYTVPKKETTGFTKDSSNKSDLISNVLRTACEKAVQYLEKNELPPHWDRDVLFGHLNANSDDGLSESETSEDDPREDKDRFVAQLYKFMDERGTPINKVPTVCNKDLDLYKLYKIVTSKGGYNKVSNSSQWKPVTVKMGYGTMPTTSTINLVKQAYKKFLQNFEELYRKLGCSFITSVDARPSSAAGKSRSHRSIFRERHASSSIKEIKKVEEPKVEKEEEEKRISPIQDNTETESVLSDTGSKMSEQSEESTRRSRSRLDSSRSKKDSDESSEKQEKPIPPTKSKRVYKKKTDTAAAAAAAQTSDMEKVGNENSIALASTNVIVTAAPPVVATTTATTVSTTVVTSLSPGPTISGGSKRGSTRGKYNKKKEKEPPVEEEAIKSEAEEVQTSSTSAHIGKNVKIQLGDKLQVYYGPQSEGNVTYEAKVVDIDEVNQKYLVHYTGWNTRYDEWINRFRISSLSVGSRQEQGKSTEGGGVRQQQEGGKGLSDSNSDLEAVQPNKPPSTPKTTITSTTTTRRKGRPLSGSQSSTATTASNSGTSSSSSSKAGSVGGRRRQPSESEKVRTQRKPRRKSGQDSSFTQSGSGSSAEDDNSDEDGHPPTPTPAIKPSIASSPSLRASKVNSRNSTKKVIDDDASSASSSASNTQSGKSAKKLEPLGLTVTSSQTTPITTISNSTNNNLAQNQVLDLNQIRSEMKGLDKMIKSSQPPTPLLSTTTTVTVSNTSTITTTTSAAIPMIVVPQSSSEDKLDIYEFQDDASDTPKLKMFSPRSPEKKDEASVSKGGSEALLKTTQQQHPQEDSSLSKESSVGGSNNTNTMSSPSTATMAVAATTNLLPSNTTGSTATKNLLPAAQMITKTEGIKGKKESPCAEALLPSTATKTKSYSPSGHGPKSTNVTATTSTSSHSFHGAITIPSHSTAGIAKMQNVAASQMLQVNPTPIETKSTLRMLTPMLHTPQQPQRQRAVMSHSFPPPPLIPSSLSSAPLKTILPVPIQPRSCATSPPMPSLVQRPPVITSTSIMGTGLPTTPQIQQHLRPIAPTNLSVTPGVISSTLMPHSSAAFQSIGSSPAAVVRSTGEPKSPSFVSRQQELFPNLVQQQQSKHSGKSVGMPIPKLTTTTMPHSSTSASVNISLSPIPISSISPSQTMFHSSSATTTSTVANKGEVMTKGLPLKSHGGDGIMASNHPSASGPPLPKKPNLKRKKPVKDKNQQQQQVDNTQLATSVILPDVVTGGAVSNLSKPKKKPKKKVITKNIIDLQKEAILRDKPEEQVTTKKPRKPSKKKMKLEQVENPGLTTVATTSTTTVKIKPEKPVKTKVKPQPRRKNNTSNKIGEIVSPPQLHPAKGKNIQPAVHSVSGSPNISTAAHYLLTPSATSSNAAANSGTSMMMVGIGGGALEMGKPPELLPAHSVIEPKQLKGGQFGVLKSVEKKSYAPKMSAATAARVISCIDNVAKLPVDTSLSASSHTIDQPSSSPLPLVINTTSPASSLGIQKSSLNVLPAVGKIPAPALPGVATTTTSLTISKVSKISGDSRVLTTTSSTDVHLSPMMMTKPSISFPTTASTRTTTLVISSSNEFSSLSCIANQSQKNSKQSTVVTQEMTKLSAAIAASKNLEIKEEKNLVSSFAVDDTASSSLMVGCVTRDKEGVYKSRAATNNPSVKSEDKGKTIKDWTSTSATVPATTVFKEESKEPTTTKEEDESCHSLLCEEIIPGSPGSPGDDDSPFGNDDENARPPGGHSTGLKKEQSSSTKLTSFNSSMTTHSPPSHQRNQAYSGSRNNSSGSTTITTCGKQEKNSVDSSLTTFPGIPPRTTDSGAHHHNTVKKEDNNKDFDRRKAEDNEMMMELSKASLGASTESNLSILQKHREVGKAAQSLLSLSGGMERPSTSGNSGFNSHPTVQLMDNTPPTTPESSSISSGSPRVDGGRVSPTNDHPSSSKSKDSSDADSADNQKLCEAAEEDFSSDAGRKSTKGRGILSPQKKKHVESSCGRNARTSSPPLKRRRIQRKKSQDEAIRSYSYRGRGSGGRKGNSSSNDNEHHGRTLPPPPLNIAKPPLSNKFNFIPDLDDDLESEQRIQVLQQALLDIKEKYIEIKAELASFERRRKRWRKKEKGRLSQKST